MMIRVIEQCAAALSAMPDAVLSAARVGAKVPVGSGEVPAIVIGLTVDATPGSGMGRLLRLEEDETDVRGTRLAGLMTLAVWATNLTQMSDITLKLQERLRADRALLREKGFWKLQPASLEPAEQVMYQPAVGSAFAVWKQTLGYRFVCEVEDPRDESEGGIIEKIDVEMGGSVEETFALPPEQT